MRELWTGDRVDFNDDSYQTRGDSIYDVPDGADPLKSAPLDRSWPGMPDAPATASSAPRVGQGHGRRHR